MSLLTYRPEIDGLRAFAVIPVILFHMGAQWLPGGYIGVDVFFVISGFLITRIILKEYGQGSFSFRGFWLRRIRRIIPALLSMLVLTSIVGFLTLYGPDINELGMQGVASLFSVANFYFWRLAGDYWGPQAENSPLLHTWTLSVEEQFYLFFPLLLILVLKHHKRLLIPVAVFLVSFSLLLFLYGTRYHPTATFYLLPTRAWELGGGCLLAVLDGRNSHRQFTVFKPRVIDLLATIGLAAIILSYFFLSGSGGISALLVIPVLGCLFTIAFSQDRKSIANRILTLAPIVYIGKISYSLYLWHWPVFFYTHHIFVNGQTALTPIGSLPVLIALSVASYHVVERPTRRNPKVIKPILISFVGAVAFSLYLSQSDFSEDISMFSETQWKGQSYDVSPGPHSSVDYYAFAKGGVIKPYNTDTPEVVLLGDSHALMWTGVLDEIFQELGVTASFYAANATRPFFDIPIEKTRGNEYFSKDEKYIFDRARYDYLERWKPRLVIVVARWSAVHSIHETRDLIQYLQDIGSSIVLIEQPPELFFGDRDAPQYLSHLNISPRENANQFISGNQAPEYDNGRKLLNEIAADCTRCEVVQVADIFLHEEKVWVLHGSDVLYIDEDHLSEKGALKVKSRLKQVVEKHF